MVRKAEPLVLVFTIIFIGKIYLFNALNRPWDGIKYIVICDEYIYFVSMGADLVCEGGDASDASAHYQGVDVVRALVRVHRLQVHHVPGKYNITTSNRDTIPESEPI